MNFYYYQKSSNVKVFTFIKKHFAKTFVDPVQKSQSLQESCLLSNQRKIFDPPVEMIPVAYIYLLWIWLLFWKFYAILVAKSTAGEKTEVFLQSLIPSSSIPWGDVSWDPALLSPEGGCGGAVGMSLCVCVSHPSFKLKETGYRDWIFISCSMKSCVVL